MRILKRVSHSFLRRDRTIQSRTRTSRSPYSTPQRDYRTSSQHRRRLPHRFRFVACPHSLRRGKRYLTRRWIRHPARFDGDVHADGRLRDRVTRITCVQNKTGGIGSIFDQSERIHVRSLIYLPLLPLSSAPSSCPSALLCLRIYFFHNNYLPCLFCSRCFSIYIYFLLYFWEIVYLVLVYWIMVIRVYDWKINNDEEPNEDPR